MSILKSEQPIGIFDSGIGGLTVAKAVVEQLPNESIIYFGDTAHLPYGDKSALTIQSYAKKIVDFLLSHNVKMILIACNSASAAAYDLLQSYIGDRAILLNVIDPVINFLDANYSGKRVGLIGTKLTVNSQVYRKKIEKLAKQIGLHSLATPLLVPIIEEGFFEHQLIDLVLAEYLAHINLQNIEALILGCTHYSVIKKSIDNFYKNKIDLIDTAKIAASAVKQQLIAQKLLSHSKHKPTNRFYVSDYTESFAKGARLFFGEAIKVELENIF